MVLGRGSGWKEAWEPVWSDGKKMLYRMTGTDAQTQPTTWKNTPFCSPGEWQEQGEPS